MSMRTIAFYLPQFHEIPENNEWWGQGYTEWTSVKKAKTVSRFHEQPHVPFENNYYDLLDKETMRWQSEISMKAGLYGFCFYHYWFHGKQLLEKPVDHYLRWTDLKQRFCLSWANESWIRTWSNVSIDGNVWNDNENRDDAPQKKRPCYLVKQDYGDKEDWKKHFEYLLPFFKDDRYIYVDGMPVFIIYKPMQIRCLTPMLSYWRALAKESGLKGIYVIGTNIKDGSCRGVDASLMYEPSYTLNYHKPFYYRYRDEWIAHKKERDDTYRKCRVYDYPIFMRKILRRKPGSPMKCYRGLFTGYDDTPRRGKNGMLFRGASPCRFLKTLMKMDKQVAEDDFVFLTAWNEWGEGAYLEPDTKWRYGYLNALRKVCGRHGKKQRLP